MASRLFALVDCSRERLVRPDLAGTPIAVLSGNGECVAARSEEVKAIGVPRAMIYYSPH